MYAVPATRVMRLRGIRNDVEAAELDMQVMNKTFTGGSMIAFTRIPLKVRCRRCTTGQPS